MARNPKYDILFEPLQVGPKTLRNRFVQAAHCMGAGTERPEFQARFRGMKAEGGWALVSTEYCSISPETDDTDRVAAKIWDDDDTAALAMLADAAHEHGALAAVELWHGGQYAKTLESRAAAVGPTQVASVAGTFMTACKEMDKSDIRRALDQYAQAAVRAREAGIDVITVHATAGAALPHIFLLPLYNHRTDEYGGSFENRARFAREALEAVREAAGHDIAVTMRFTFDTLPLPYGFGDAGARPDGDSARFLEHLDDLVDLWDLNIGAAFAWGEDATPSRFHPEGYAEPIIAQARQHTGKPIMTVGRYTNPDSMVRLITSGVADVVGAARPSIADPFLPRKIEEGRFDDIRECIGCNYCVSRWEQGGPPIACTQNATIGEELRRGWHPEKFTEAANAGKDVLVIGAGPAGMECAIVLGKRGMNRVHLVDAERELGGSMRWTTRLPGLGEWARVVNWRQIQIDKLKNVDFIPGTRLTAPAVLEYGAEIVVVATGSRWGRTDGTGVQIPGADAPHVFTPESVILDPRSVPQGKVVVYDLDGYFMGVSVAELLAQAGREVTFITAHHTIAPYQEYTLETPRMLGTLRRLGVKTVEAHVVTAIEPGRVLGHWGFETAEAAPAEWEADAVVLTTQRHSIDGLYHELKADPAGLERAGIEALYRIGDAVAPRIIAEAIFDGHRLAREIDAEDPEVPLLYTRERPATPTRLSA